MRVYPSLFKFPSDIEIKTKAKAFCHDITDAYQTYRTVENLLNLDREGRLLPLLLETLEGKFWKRAGLLA